MAKTPSKSPSKALPKKATTGRVTGKVTKRAPKGSLRKTPTRRFAADARLIVKPTTKTEARKMIRYANALLRAAGAI